MYNSESPLYTLTVSEYIQLQKELLEGAIMACLPVQKTQEAELLDMKKAAEFLGMSESTLYSMRCRDTIPSVKRRGKVFFWKSELVKWLNTNK